LELVAGVIVVGVGEPVPGLAGGDFAEEPHPARTATLIARSMKLVRIRLVIVDLRDHRIRTGDYEPETAGVQRLEIDCFGASSSARASSRTACGTGRRSRTMPAKLKRRNT
jgi:hypothetical protein